MAAPSYATDLTDIVVPVITTGSWAAYGGGASALNAEADYYIIDSTCLSKNAWASDYKGAVYDNTTDVTIATGDALFVWVTHLTPNSLATEASGGIRVVMGDSATESALDEWYVAGSDTLIYDDRWLCAVVDPDETPDNDNGATANYSWFGAGANLPSGGPTKGAPFGIGGIRHGREFQCTAGDGTSGYATFDGAATYNDASTRRLGQFQKSGGVYKSQGLFVMGTASTAVDFRDSNRTIFIARTPKVGAGFNGFEVRNAGSAVYIDDCTFEALGTQSPGYWETVDGADVILQRCAFVNMSTFGLTSGDAFLGCTWRGCGQITAPGSDLAGSSVSGYEGTADTGALVWDVATNPDGLLDGMTFTKGAAATHAIEFGTSIPSAITLSDMTFSGYGADTTTSAALYFADTAGTITVTLVGTATPTYKSAGATIVFVTSPVTVEVTSLEPDGTPVGSCRVLLRATSATGSLPAGDTVTIVNSGTTATVTHTAHGLATNDLVEIVGASLVQNLGIFQITVTGVNTYTYTMGSTPGSSPTGTIKATFVFLSETTNATTGKASVTLAIPADQSVQGWCRKSSAADNPKYAEGPLTGTVSFTSGASLAGVMIEN